ncbi:hypothetical protein SEA_EVAA_14 [Gordonia phage Evaa]|nr:hypothetical protein SEA_EVAA_14 [Gordonia phage Evaa]
MPEGIIATVDEGFATLDFVDRSLRGPAIQKLLEIGGPETIETLTRSGPRRQYRVPEGNAREAGLLDVAEPTLFDTPDDEPTAPPVTTPEPTPEVVEPTPEVVEPTPEVIEPVTEVAEPTEETEAPSLEWKYDRLRAYAVARNINVDGLRSKAEVLAAIEGADQ